MIIQYLSEIIVYQIIILITVQDIFMQIAPIKTELIQLNDDLFSIIKNIHLKDKDILVISSKIIALSQGRIGKTADFEKILKQESDLILSKNKYALTIKNGILIPNAGIDHSNSMKGILILWPKDLQKYLDDLREKIKKHFKIRNIGLIGADSHCVPLRRGVSGIALAYSGFIGVEDLRGEKDIYNNVLEVTQRNIADMLASCAVLVMNEGNQKTPMSIIRESNVEFTPKLQNSIKELQINPKECLFAKLYPKKIMGKYKI